MPSHTEMGTGDSSENVVGDRCKVLGLTRNSLLSSVENNNAFRSPKHSGESLSNGLVLELFRLKETEKLTFKAFTTWLEGDTRERTFNFIFEGSAWQSEQTERQTCIPPESKQRLVAFAF